MTSIRDINSENNSNSNSDNNSDSNSDNNSDSNSDNEDIVGKNVSLENNKYQMSEKELKEINDSKINNVGNFIMTIIFSIFTGFFNFLKSNWVFILIFGTIGFVIYYIYTNAMNFFSGFFDIFKNIKPVLDSSIDMLNTSMPLLDPSNNKINSITKPTTLDNSSGIKATDNSLEKSLKSNDKEKPQDDIENESTDGNVDDGEQDKTISHSYITSNISDKNLGNPVKGLEGYCFIGEENNIRACAPVGKNNKCMSGEIFPTMEICMNPDLRE